MDQTCMYKSTLATFTSNQIDIFNGDESQLINVKYLLIIIQKCIQSLYLLLISNLKKILKSCSIKMDQSLLR